MTDKGLERLKKLAVIILIMAGGFELAFVLDAFYKHTVGENWYIANAPTVCEATTDKFSDELRCEGRDESFIAAALLILWPYSD